jgi:CDGSH-type Zn-finger protein
LADDEVVITPYRDGPLLVRGPFRLQDQEGNPIDVGRRTVALCRCGKSRIRPFCDGTHALVRFRAPSEAERGREAGAAARPDVTRFARDAGDDAA